jgi:hypothetical protein
MSSTPRPITAKVIAYASRGDCPVVVTGGVAAFMVVDDVPATAVVVAVCWRAPCPVPRLGRGRQQREYKSAERQDGGRQDGDDDLFNGLP